MVSSGFLNTGCFSSFVSQPKYLFSRESFPAHLLLLHPPCTVSHYCFFLRFRRSRTSLPYLPYSLVCLAHSVNAR